MSKSEQRCEADVRLVSAANIRDITKEITVKCDSCPFKSISRRVKLTDDLSSREEAIRLARKAVEDGCGKWKTMLEHGEVVGEMPDSFLPPFEYAYRLPRRRSWLRYIDNLRKFF